MFSELVRYIYSIDQPVNCFPSIHVLTTFVIMLAAFKRREQHAFEYYILTFFGTLIILSTLFTKQHAFVDAISGMTLASILYFGVQLLLAKETVRVPVKQNQKCKSRLWLLSLLFYIKGDFQVKIAVQSYHQSEYDLLFKSNVKYIRNSYWNDDISDYHRWDNFPSFAGN